MPVIILCNVRLHCKMRRSILFSVFILISLSSIVVAEVGVGISPSKVVLQIEGGESLEQNFLVFNSGTHVMEISLKASEEIADITTIEPISEVVDPEPIPHELPIKNGKSFKVTFNPPATRETVTYSGTISASGSPTEGSQFGGSVGVATYVEIIVTPTKSIFAFVTMAHIIIAIVLAVLILLLYFLKKAGLSIKFKKK